MKIKRINSKAPVGFTLVELLVVIAIVAILAAVVMLIVNPIEVTKRARDATRLADIANVQQAINVTVQESTQTTEITLCAPSGTTPCPGRSNTSPVTSQTKTDGTGWVKVNLQTQNAVSVPNLPLDPQNTSTYHYTYCSDGTTWEIDADLESLQYTTGTTTNKELNDGGSDDDLYETGSDPNLDLIDRTGSPTCAF